MVKLTVDGIEVEVPNGASVLQACEAAGKEIPRFCYHDRLSVAGNCRVCMVEIERVPKPVASCAYPVAEGMKVSTESTMARNARRNGIEFLLINHPLDCPICDQGGECDLQDQNVAYGASVSRFREPKRAVSDKYVGPLIKTVMTRCIHCTRCIRFLAEVAGVPELGGIGRGEDMEISPYVEKALTSELSSNIVDVCPVGALTSKPYAFIARPWELTRTDGIDVADAVGTNIRIDSRGPEVLRVLPRVNEDVNEEWLADKGRHWIDGLKRRRLDRPWVRRDGKLQPADWDAAFSAIQRGLADVPGARIAALAGDLCEAESLFALRELLARLGSDRLECRQDGARLDASRRDFYLFNTTIPGIEEADAVVLIGTNPRREAPVLNARIRKRYLTGDFRAGMIGPEVDVTYPVTMLGASPADIAGAAAFLAGAERPMVIVGQGALARADGAAVLAAAWRLAAEAGALRADWHGFNVLHMAAGRVGALDLGYGKAADPEAVFDADVLYLLAADEFDVSRIRPDTFVIYQGHHGDAGAARADVILPGAAYTEKNGTWVNTEGRVQSGFRAIYPPGEAKEDWRILRALSAVLGVTLPFDHLPALRERLVQAFPLFGRIGTLEQAGCTDRAGPAGDPEAVGAGAFVLPVTDYYQTSAICRASPTMAACSAEILSPTLVMAAE